MHLANICSQPTLCKGLGVKKLTVSLFDSTLLDINVARPDFLYFTHFNFEYSIFYFYLSNKQRNLVFKGFFTSDLRVLAFSDLLYIFLKSLRMMGYFYYTFIKQKCIILSTFFFCFLKKDTCFAFSLLHSFDLH